MIKKVLFAVFTLTILSSFSIAQVNRISGVRLYDQAGITKHSDSEQKKNIDSGENIFKGIQILKYLPDTIHGGYTNDSVRNVRTYDLNGKLLQDIGEYWLKNSWVYPQRKTYNYDSNENLLEILGEFKSNDVWIKNSKDSYKIGRAHV